MPSINHWWGGGRSDGAAGSNTGRAPPAPPAAQGVVRVENLEDATEHVPMVLQRVKPEYLVCACACVCVRACVGEAWAQ